METADQKKIFGYPLKHFRVEKELRHNVVGGKNKRSIFSVAGFAFKNLEQSDATIEETLIATINEFANQTLGKINANGKSVTLVLRHKGLRESDKSFFCNLNNVMNPGLALLSFFERFGQSNKKLTIQNDMDIDFIVST